jgi:hypothetical protein
MKLHLATVTLSLVPATVLSREELFVEPFSAKVSMAASPMVSAKASVTASAKASAKVLVTLSATVLVAAPAKVSGQASLGKV